MTEESLFSAVVYVGIAMGIGATINIILEKYGIKFPAYLMGMVVAAIMRNIIDASQKPLPFNEIGVIGNISLSLFLSMALMSMKLWELVELAGPLSIILLVQTVVMALFAYFVTFNIMGRDYDAAGPSVKAFFIIPIVGSLFIDFVNAMVIKGFASWIVANFM